MYGDESVVEIIVSTLCYHCHHERRLRISTQQLTQEVHFYIKTNVHVLVCSACGFTPVHIRIKTRVVKEGEG